MTTQRPRLLIFSTLSLIIGFFIFTFTIYETVGAEVVLAWNPSPSLITGYKIYYGPQHGTYTNCVMVSNVLTVTIQNLKPNTVYYFVATAYDAESESDFSNEAAYTTISTSEPPNIPMVCIPQGVNSPTALQIQTRIGNAYDVEVSTNLLDWQTIVTTGQATNEAYIRVIDMTPWNDRKFYRVRVH